MASFHAHSLSHLQVEVRLHFDNNTIGIGSKLQFEYIKLSYQCVKCCNQHLRWGESVVTEYNFI